MIYKTITTSKGALKYRLPDISEGYDFLALVDQMKNGSDILKAKAKMIRSMESLIDFSECGYSTYTELLNDKEHMAIPMKDIVHEVFEDVTGMFRKKH